ncbi:MAG: rhomboid family intramembrane serine protease [Acidobacteriota bacterium]|nr:rhomboid family intramembrane serine protease [Acidobacteriota bacterium]
MSSGADLFVVCKQCGAEVSPYITECPYCGTRLRKRAPKLPREAARRKAPRGLGKRTERALRSAPATRLGRLRHGEIPGIAAPARPYATIAIVLASAAVWVAWQGGAFASTSLIVLGPLHGEWWRLLTHELIYGYSPGAGTELYELSALAAVAIFGSLLEARHGMPTVAATFLGAGVAGALVTIALYPAGVSSGANAGSLALLCAWAVPDLLSATRREPYDGDLTFAAVLAAVLLAIPFAFPPASWSAGLTGALIGLLAGAGLSRLRGARS